MLVNVSRFKNVQSKSTISSSHEFARIKAAIEIHAQPPVTGQDTHAVLRQLASRSRPTSPTQVDLGGRPRQAVRGRIRHDRRARQLVAGQVERRQGAEHDRRRWRRPVARAHPGRPDGQLLLQARRRSRHAAPDGAMVRLPPGYDDLVRVWISPEVADQFRFVSDVTDELREQIREMRELGKTPEDFGLMVRKHPETLAITAKRGVCRGALDGHLAVWATDRDHQDSRNERHPAGPMTRRSRLPACHRSDDPSGGWDQPGLDYPGKVGVSKDRVADLLEALPIRPGQPDLGQRSPQDHSGPDCTRVPELDGRSGRRQMVSPFSSPRRFSFQAPQARRSVLPRWFDRNVQGVWEQRPARRQHRSRQDLHP